MAERVVLTEFVFQRTGEISLAHAYRILVPERRGRGERAGCEIDGGIDDRGSEVDVKARRAREA